MTPFKGYLTRRLTVRDTIVAILAVGLLAGLVYLAYVFTAAKILEARVGAALPTVCASVRKQRAAIVNAIEAYKARFGLYPPDHVVSRQPMVVDAVTNTLLYELTGVLYNPVTRMFQVAGMEPAEAGYVTNFFQCDGFKNCAETAERLQHFLEKEAIAARQLHDDPDVFALGFNVPSDAIAPELFWEIEISPWRYVCSFPTNNSGKFDLWIELKHKDRTTIVGNWKGVE